MKSWQRQVTENEIKSKERINFLIQEQERREKTMKQQFEKEKLRLVQQQSQIKISFEKELNHMIQCFRDFDLGVIKSIFEEEIKEEDTSDHENDVPGSNFITELKKEVVNVFDKRFPQLCEEKNSETEQLTEKLQKLEKSSQDLEKKNKSQADQIKNLQESLNSKEDAQIGLQNEIETLKITISSYVKPEEAQIHDENIAQLKQEREQLLNEVNEKESEISSLSQHIEHFKTLFEQQKQKTEEITKNFSNEKRDQETKSLSFENQRLSSEIESQRKSLDEKEKQISELLNENQKLSLKFKVLDGDQETKLKTQGKIQQMQQDHLHLQEFKQKLTANTQNLLHFIWLLNSSSRYSETSSPKPEKITTTVFPAEIVSKIEKLIDEKKFDDPNSFEVVQKALQFLYEELIHTKINLREQVKENESRVAEKESLSSSFRDELKDAIAKMKNQLQIDTEKSKKEKLKDKMMIAALQKQIKHYQSQNNPNSSAFVSQKDENTEELVTKITHLEQLRDLLQEKNKTLSDLVEQQQQTLEKEKKNLLSIQVELQTFQKSLATKKLEISTLKNKNSSEIQHYFNEIKRLKEKCEILQKEKEELNQKANNSTSYNENSSSISQADIEEAIKKVLEQQQVVMVPSPQKLVNEPEKVVDVKELKEENEKMKKKYKQIKQKFLRQSLRQNELQSFVIRNLSSSEQQQQQQNKQEHASPIPILSPFFKK